MGRRVEGSPEPSVYQTRDNMDRTVIRARGPVTLDYLLDEAHENLANVDREYLRRFSSAIVTLLAEGGAITGTGLLINTDTLPNSLLEQSNVEGIIRTRSADIEPSKKNYGLKDRVVPQTRIVVVPSNTDKRLLINDQGRVRYSPPNEPGSTSSKPFDSLKGALYTMGQNHHQLIEDKYNNRSSIESRTILKATLFDLAETSGSE